MKYKHTKCSYCRRSFSEEVAHLKRTKDHFMPISRGGNNAENILQACQECNCWKADKMPDFWLSGVLYLSKRKSIKGNYTLCDYRQIIGSIKHWVKFFKGKKIGTYKFK